MVIEWARPNLEIAVLALRLVTEQAVETFVLYRAAHSVMEEAHPNWLAMALRLVTRLVTKQAAEISEAEIPVLLPTQATHSVMEARLATKLLPPRLVMESRSVTDSGTQHLVMELLLPLLEALAFYFVSLLHLHYH